MRPEYSDEIVSLTKGYGGDWGINHTLRLLHLIEIIGKGREYDPDVVWVAAYLHDWGGYSPWIQPGINQCGQINRSCATLPSGKGFPWSFHRPYPGMYLPASQRGTEQKH